MRDVTAFVGGAWDRAAHLRADDKALGDLWLSRDARCLVFWRGRPLAAGGTVAFLPCAHPVLAGVQVPIFLGLADGGPVFAVTLADWEGADQGENRDAPGVNDQRRWTHPLVAGDFGFAELRSLMGTIGPGEGALAATAKALIGWHETHGFCARCGGGSAMAMAGWRRDCKTCRAPHFPRTDPVVIMLVTRGNRLLVGRTAGWADKMYSLLAGFVEPGETIEEAVRREVYEETRVTVGPVRYRESQPWPFPASLMIGCEGRATSDEIMLDPLELEDAFWISREELAMAFVGAHPRMRPPRPGSIAATLMSDWLADRR